MGKYFLGPLEMVTGTEPRCLYGGLMTAERTGYNALLTRVLGGAIRAEGRVEFVFTSPRKAPFLLLGFCNNDRSAGGFFTPPEIKGTFQNGNLENYTHTHL